MDKKQEILRREMRLAMRRMDFPWPEDPQTKGSKELEELTPTARTEWRQKEYDNLTKVK